MSCVQVLRSEAALHAPADGQRCSRTAHRYASQPQVLRFSLDSGCDGLINCSLTHSTPIHVFICGHRHKVACLQTSTYARCVLKRMSLFLVTRFESKKQVNIFVIATVLSNSLFVFFFWWANQISNVSLFVSLFCLRGIASSRVNTGNSLGMEWVNCFLSVVLTGLRR